jgi:hypothetical protein
MGFQRRDRYTLFNGDIHWRWFKKPHHVYIWANRNWWIPTSLTMTIDRKITWSTRGGFKSVRTGYKKIVYRDYRGGA